MKAKVEKKQKVTIKEKPIKIGSEIEFKTSISKLEVDIKKELLLSDEVGQYETPKVEVGFEKEAHETWCKTLKKKGWVYGEKLDKKKKTHPNLVSYKQLKLKA